MRFLFAPFFSVVLSLRAAPFGAFPLAALRRAPETGFGDALFGRATARVSGRAAGVGVLLRDFLAAGRADGAGSFRFDFAGVATAAALVFGAVSFAFPLLRGLPVLALGVGIGAARPTAAARASRPAARVSPAGSFGDAAATGTGVLG